MAKRGRPKKQEGDKVRPGQLQSGLMYFNFIADSQKVADLRNLSKAINIPIKELMDKALVYILEKQYKPEKKTHSHTRNENLMKEYLAKKATQE